MGWEDCRCISSVEHYAALPPAQYAVPRDQRDGADKQKGTHPPYMHYGICECGPALPLGFEGRVILLLRRAATGRYRPMVR